MKKIILNVDYEPSIPGMIKSPRLPYAKATLPAIADLSRMSRTELEDTIRAQVQSTYLGHKKVLARVLGSYKLFLSTEDLGLSSHLMLDGYWESWLTLFFLRFIREGMVVIDVGANFGYYTILFSAAVGARGRVIAIEPNPSTFECLKDSVALNGFTNRTQLILAAAGNKIETVANLIVPAKEPKNAHVSRIETADSIPVRNVAIDTIVIDRKSVDLIKIDVEGAEVDVLYGMENTIETFRPAILLEYNKLRYADPKSILRWLQRHYSKISVLNWDGELLPANITSIVEDRSNEDQLLFFER